MVVRGSAWLIANCMSRPVPLMVSSPPSVPTMVGISPKQFSAACAAKAPSLAFCAASLITGLTFPDGITGVISPVETLNGVRLHALDVIPLVEVTQTFGWKEGRVQCLPR